MEKVEQELNLSPRGGWQPALIHATKGKLIPNLNNVENLTDGRHQLLLCAAIKSHEKTKKKTRQALMELMPMWPGIAPDAQRAVVEHITTNHFLDWSFDVFKLQVGIYCVPGCFDLISLRKRGEGMTAGGSCQALTFFLFYAVQAWVLGTNVQRVYVCLQNLAVRS